MPASSRREPHGWPEGGGSGPTDALRKAVTAAGGDLDLTAGELGARFGVQRLTRSARERIAGDLRRAGLTVSPPIEDAQRTEKLRVSAAGRRGNPLPARFTDPARPAASTVPNARRRRVRWLTWGIAAIVLLAVIGALTGGSDDTKPGAGAAGKATRTATTPEPTTTADPVAGAHRRARELTSRGRYLAAVALLDRHDALARRIRRRGAHVFIARARDELVASHDTQARAYARRARRLGATTTAAAIIRTANAHTATERAAARERRRLAAIARDQRTCSTAEKAAVDGGAATPAGCQAYAAQVAAKQSAPASSCDPNYAGACLDPNAYDYDCEGGSGDGPEYTGAVRVVGDDHYDLDRDGDGIACET